MSPFSWFRRAGWVCLAVALSCSGGCQGRSDGPPRVVVAGSATYDGQPIERGTIRFVPDASSNLPLTVATIANGTYRADNKGGVPVGTHRVEIHGFRTTDGGANADPAHVREEQYLPAKYHAESTLTIDVRADTDVLVQDFTLER